MSLVITAEPIPLYTKDGVVLVRGTRVPLDTVVIEFKQGATAEEIAQQYSSLELADVYAVISYYLRHESEVETYLQQQQQDAKQVREENERRFPSHGLRDCLLARRQLRNKR
ncbi:MAG: DUF433 domain-containing protein [Myxacorys californica WJT36-NPBG1]|jgi:uncharacterized protein (DUF433 family)|nr:DUF433 domain-containing protein [Myxacorys californica WJT36-NPBG1]